jgi:hypothetical protein
VALLDIFHRNKLTNLLDDSIKSVTPGSGAQLNKQLEAPVKKPTITTDILLDFKETRDLWN